MFLSLIGIMLFGLSGTVKAATCGKCGKTVSVKTHEGVRYPDTSCQYYSCSCGYKDGWSHKWNVSTTAATCTTPETTSYSCSRNISYHQYSVTNGSALGHNYGSWYTVTSATCTSAGTKRRECTRSGCSSYETGTISALGHSYGEYTVTKAATCTVNGLKTRTCSRCGGTDSAVIPATGHSYTGTCPLCGTTNVVCTNTGCDSVKTHTCDTTPPTVTFETNGSTKPVSKASTKITVTATSEIDTSSLKYQWTQSTTAPETSTFIETFTNGQTITFSGGSGIWYLWIHAKDIAGNTAIVSSGAFELDIEAPEGTINIVAAYENAGIKYTKNQKVTINLTATDDVSSTENIKVALINENNFSLTNPNSGINWLNFSASKTWTLSSNSGMKTVYVIFKDEAGNQSLYLAQ